MTIEEKKSESENIMTLEKLGGDGKLRVIKIKARRGRDHKFSIETHFYRLQQNRFWKRLQEYIHIYS